VTGAKPFTIPKRLVYEAFKAVKANAGSAGVDQETIEDFEKNLKDNLYRIWNRMSSGSYFPPPVKAVAIPKKNGGERILGVPTVADRVAQMVVKTILEPVLEPVFLSDSYGYRPGKSALDAIAITRNRCWRYDWVLEFDIKGLFDNISHDLLLRALEKHTGCEWARLYIRRWLTAPLQLADGTLVERTRGTPQGGVVSPILANLFLHYAFDAWMVRTFPGVPWCRYADDGLIHCKTETQALAIKAALAERFAQCGLEMRPDKTHVVYCKDGSRKGQYSNTKFDFLGYTFSAAGREESQTKQSVCELHASGQRIGSQNHAGNHATVELPKSNGTEPQGYRSSTQSGPAWLDGVLWAVLSVSDVSGPQALRQNVGRLGDEEVQTVERPQDTGEPLPRKHRGKASRSVRALAEGGGWQARLMGAV